MLKWKGWRCLKVFSLCQAKSALLKVTSHLSSFSQAKGQRNGLWNLHKDMESCGEYEDIQVMWKMLQSSSSSLYAYKAKRSNISSSYLLLCFRPA
ncbi:hypothetical protein L6164_000104 [Bauhinia variegata]|uniref:Uncharacterized protein n=1 Tax=Bauhinia variegata TaxID=167791 RepID=A0ACB9Q4W2_BAUVA|nr:hypothetical protein L6164_000104 [Bauhinia variegata]